jgi:hypothetical protein
VLERYRHANLLGSLVLLIFVFPMLGELPLGGHLVELILSIAMISSILACSPSTRHTVVGFALILLMQAVSWIPGLAENRFGPLGVPIIALTVFGYTAALMLRKIFFDTPMVTSDTIYGAVSVYLLFGLIWTLAYTILEGIEPGSFLTNGLTIEPNYDRFLGFSFVTLSTLGYGNVVPTTPRADAMASSEAIVGQIYLTVLVARLVAMHMRDSKPSDKAAN